MCAVLGAVFLINALSFRSFHRRNTSEFVKIDSIPLKTIPSYVASNRKSNFAGASEITRKILTELIVPTRQKKIYLNTKAPYSKRRSVQPQKDKKIRTTERSKSYPATCPCKKANPQKNSFCFFYTNKPFCEYRSCKPSFVCVSRNTGLTCYRKKKSRSVVPDYRRKGTCVRKTTSKYVYVPYSGSF